MNLQLQRLQTLLSKPSNTLQKSIGLTCDKDTSPMRGVFISDPGDIHFAVELEKPCLVLGRAFDSSHEGGLVRIGSRKLVI